MIYLINLIFIACIILTAITALRVKNMIVAVFVLGAYSFFLAILWTVLGAADVSFTEAMIGVGASTIFFVLAIFQTGSDVKERLFLKKHTLPLLLLGVLAIVFFWGSLDLPFFGEINSVPSAYLSPYYLTHAYHDSHTPNVVTAVVVDYRGFDTLIEATVIFTAGLACLLIMRGDIND